jgi:nucleoside-diphosphate-sugar epimerase
MSDLIVTGASGRIGSVLRPYISFRGHDLKSEDLRTSTDLLKLITNHREDCTILHLAGSIHADLGASGDAIAMLLNVIRICDECGVRRLIYASSLAAAPEENDLSYHNYYTATKRTGEAFTQAWAKQGGGRVGVSLRFGAYPLPEFPITCRMSREALIYWIRRALKEDRPGYHVWNASSLGAAERSHDALDIAGAA